MELICFKCQRVINADTVREYARHLRMAHTVFEKGETLVCGQSGCMRTFTLMNSLLRHIRLQHRDQHLQYDNHVGELAQDQDRDRENNEEEVQGNYDEDIEDAEQVYEQEFFNLSSLKNLAMNLVINLKSSTSTIYSAIQSVISCTKTMFKETLSSPRQRMITVMQQHGVDTNSPDVQELSFQFQELENPWNETPGQQMKYMIDNLNLVPPVERALGTRIDQKLNRKTGEIKQVIVTETFQYVPVLEVLKLVLKPDIRVLIESCLGSKKGIHKLGLFYYSIQNLPPCYSSSMNSVISSSSVLQLGFEEVWLLSNFTTVSRGNTITGE